MLLGSIETQNLGQCIKGNSTRPESPHVHGVIDLFVDVTGETNVEPRHDSVNNAALVDEREIELHNIVADELVDSLGEFPEFF